METVFEYIDLPIYVYILELIFIVLGIRESKSYTDARYFTHLRPLLMFVLLTTQTVNMIHSPYMWMLFFILLVGGFFLGFFFLYPEIIAYNAQKRTITFKGSLTAVLLYASIAILWIVGERDNIYLYWLTFIGLNVLAGIFIGRWLSMYPQLKNKKLYV